MLNSLYSYFFQRALRGRPGPTRRTRGRRLLARPPKSRPFLEQLEDRTVPSVVGGTDQNGLIGQEVATLVQTENQLANLVARRPAMRTASSLRRCRRWSPSKAN
jgi:hypothetical protein